MLKSVLAGAVAALLLAGCAGTSKMAAATPPTAPPAPPPPQRSITELADGIYRFQDNQHYGVFMVTKDGVGLADPLNKAAATWVSGEIESRFHQPVKYVLYSHKDFDHASGGAVFPTATVISQADTKALLTPPADGAPLAGFLAASDTNKDNLLQKSEAPPFMAAQFDAFDTNHDGALSAHELFVGQFADVRPPDETYKDKLNVKLGGRTVTMIHVGGLHSSDMSFIWFPKEKILFVVDVISLKRMPFANMAGFNEADTYALIDKAKALKPKIVAGGHGAVGTLADLKEFRQYHKDLIDGVKAGIAAGKPLEEIQKTLLLEKYKDWVSYDQFRTQNIAGIYAYLTKKPS